MIDQSIIEDILKHADIVDVIASYINVIKKGRNYVAVCPFHDDKNPSMMISKEKQIFKCFVCGTGGNAITFIQKYENISFENAVKKLAELIGYKDARLNIKSTASKQEAANAPLYVTCEELTKFYMMTLLAKEGEEGKKYLTERFIDDEVIKQFRIGFCPNNPLISIKYLQAKNCTLKDIETIGVAGHSNGQYVDKNAGRVVFPLTDINGKVVGYSARKINNSDEAKYVNSPETPLFQKGNIIYNYANAKKTARLDGYCYLLEGFMDVIALYRAGVKSAVALMGTALTMQQVNLLKRLNVEIRLCLDSDNPGQMATLKAIELFDKSNVKYRIVRRSNGPKDADEILDKYGKENLIKWLNILIDKVQFAMNYFSRTNPLNTIDERKRFILDFLPFLKNVNSELELEEYIVNIAKITNFDRKVITNALEKYKKNNTREENTNITLDIHPERKALKRLQLTERMFVYQMLYSKKALEFYKDKDVPLSNEIFSKIASYIMEYYRNHENMTINDLINSVAQSGDKETDVIVSSITELSFENHYPECSNDLLNELYSIIQKERAEEYDNFIFEESTKGKSDVEQLRILRERNIKKNAQLNKK